MYFTRDTSATHYADFNPTEIDSSIFQSSNSEITQFFNRQIKIHHFPHDLINTSWSSLHWFNNDFCLYGPSDKMYITRTFLTDSAFYFLSADHTLAIIQSYTKVSPQKWKFRLIDARNKEIITTIELIDAQKGIAIWESKNSTDDIIIKELKVRSENVQLFPIIICSCFRQKCLHERMNFFSLPHFLN